MSNVRARTGVPQVSDFASSTGTPIVINLTTGTAYYLKDGVVTAIGGGGGASSWGGITGTLSDQTDLQSALDAKANVSSIPTIPAWVEVEHDFGTKPVYDHAFTITDAAISATSKVVIAPSGKAATGRTADDWQWDGATIVASPGSGSATCYVTFHPGPVVGYRKFEYQVN